MQGEMPLRVITLSPPNLFMIRSQDGAKEFFRLDQQQRNTQRE